MTEMEIHTRITEISNEYSQLSELDNYDLSLEAVGDNGDVKVTLKKPNIIFERIIGHKEPLDWICDTFNYPYTFTPRSRDFALEGLRRAYFDHLGYLMIEHDDGTMERFNVKSEQKSEVIDKLKAKLGKKLKI